MVVVPLIGLHGYSEYQSSFGQVLIDAVTDMILDIKTKKISSVQTMNYTIAGIIQLSMARNT